MIYLDSRNLNKLSRPNRRSDEEIFTCLRPATITRYKRQLRHLTQTFLYFYSELLSNCHSSSKIQPKKTITHPSPVSQLLVAQRWMIHSQSPMPTLIVDECVTTKRHVSRSLWHVLTTRTWHLASLEVNQPESKFNIFYQICSVLPIICFVI